LELVDGHTQPLIFRLAIGGRLGLGFQLCQSLLRCADPGLELISLHEALLIGVDQASDSTPGARDQSRGLLRRSSKLLARAA
jgi:hypothetical protein